MERSWMKTLAIGLCWLLIVCDGADQSVTVEDIIRSVTAVRAQIGMALKDRLALQTTANRIAPVRAQPPNTGNSGRVPGLSILFRRVPSSDRTTTTAANAYLPPLEASTSSPTTVPSSATGIVGSDGLYSSTVASVEPLESPDPTSALRSNPLGIIFPSQEQLDQFNGQFARPWTGNAGGKSRPSTTTTRVVVDFVFPTDDADDADGPTSFGRPSIVTGVTEAAIRLGTSSASSPEPSVPGAGVPGEGNFSGSSQNPPKIVTINPPIEEETTEESEGLGNRIDQKVLISLVG